MRIIDQLRTLSVNFDNLNLWVNDSIICYTSKSGDKTSRVLGRYKSCNRAKQVFREIHEKYMGLPFDNEPNVFYMPED